jgi:hypothetical protein
MYSRFAIQTRLRAVEAQRVLEELVRPRQFFLDPDPPTPDLRLDAFHAMPVPSLDDVRRSGSHSKSS